MPRGRLTMNAKERNRKSVLVRVLRGTLTLSAASGLLGLGYRQCRRMYSRYPQEGDAGLVHRGRGRPSGRSKPEEVREAVLTLYRTCYVGLGPTLSAEWLVEDGYAVDHGRTDKQPAGGILDHVRRVARAGIAHIEQPLRGCSEGERGGRPQTATARIYSRRVSAAH